MNNIVDYLKQLDLSDIEARLYLTLLKEGPTSVRDLAQSVAIKRTTAYLYIDQLVEKGLIMKLVRGSKKLVAANDPENLTTLVDQKIKKAKEIKNDFPNVLKTLNTSIPHIDNVKDAEIKYYKGKNGVLKIYEDALKANELRTYVNFTEIAKIFPSNFDLFDNALKKNSSLRIYELVEKSPISEQQTVLFKKSAIKYDKKYFYKFIPKGVEITSSNVLLYEGKVGIINLKDNVSGIILYNLDYYNISKVLFDFLWHEQPNP
jgi:sugar-specific transcriptional regulator TrmB